MISNRWIYTECVVADEIFILKNSQFFNNDGIS